MEEQKINWVLILDDLHVPRTKGLIGAVLPIVYENGRYDVCFAHGEEYLIQTNVPREKILGLGSGKNLEGLVNVLKEKGVHFDRERIRKDYPIITARMEREEGEYNPGSLERINQY
jgi:hypothetical protein